MYLTITLHFRFKTNKLKQFSFKTDLDQVKGVVIFKTEANRPFAARDHVLRYRIATPYWSASTPVISDSIEVTEVCIQTKNTVDNRSKGIPIREIQ